MSSLYFLIFISLCLGLAAWLFFLWSARSGHYDDVEGPKYRMLDDEDDELPAARKHEEKDEGPKV